MLFIRLRYLVLRAAVVGAMVFAAPTAKAQARSLSLGLSGVTLPLGSETVTQENAMSTTSSRHPQWILDLEEKMWPGFLTGLSGYEDFVMPVGMFLYFEDPFITTDIRLEYVYHDIPDRSVLGGGQVHVVAAQIRVALTERLAFLATKDGYSWVDSNITPAGDGWNDIAIGLKYAIHSDPQNHFLVSSGLRWEWANGSTDAFQGGDSQEISPFIAMAKGWDKWHFLGTLSGRIPTDRSDANASVLWNMHLDYELTDTFRPLVELHGIHWVSNADLLPLSTDYLDVGSLGASKASGRDFFSAGIGFRWQAMDNVSIGLTYEFPLESRSSHLMQQRVTFNTVISF
ncbi:MAG: hypothetical protein V3W34_20585 [Phycisphaerae bacterium]